MGNYNIHEGDRTADCLSIFYINPTFLYEVKLCMAQTQSDYSVLRTHPTQEIQVWTILLDPIDNHV